MSVWIAGRLRDKVGRAKVWELRAGGMVTAQIAEVLGTSSSVVNEWVRERGGVRPTPSAPPSGRT
jgi:DNA-binding transcriptional regulator YiaG